MLMGLDGVVKIGELPRSNTVLQAVLTAINSQFRVDCTFHAGPESVLICESSGFLGNGIDAEIRERKRWHRRYDAMVC